MHVDQMRDELLVGRESRMGAEMAVEGNSLHAKGEHLKYDMGFIVNVNIRQRSSTIHKPEQMPRQPESLAVSRLHPDLVRPQLRNILITKMALEDKQYNSHLLHISKISDEK